MSISELPEPANYDEWCWQVDALCRIHLHCGWADLCGDMEPLDRGYQIGDTPREFVRWWAAKYDLDWSD